MAFKTIKDVTRVFYDPLLLFLKTCGPRDSGHSRYTDGLRVSVKKKTGKVKCLKGGDDKGRGWLGNERFSGEACKGKRKGTRVVRGRWMEVGGEGWAV